MIRDLGKIARIVGERGGYAVTRGSPRYAMVGGKHYAVGGGRAFECDEAREAYAKVDFLIAVSKAKILCVCGARFAEHGAKAPHTIDPTCDGFRRAGRPR